MCDKDNAEIIKIQAFEDNIINSFTDYYSDVASNDAIIKLSGDNHYFGVYLCPFCQAVATSYTVSFNLADNPTASLRYRCGCSLTVDNNEVWVVSKCGRLAKNVTMQDLIDHYGANNEYGEMLSEALDGYLEEMYT